MLHGYFDLPTVAFWEFGNIWTGSLFQTFNYRIIPEKKDEEKVLRAVVWYGTDCFELVKPEDLVFEMTEELSVEGLERIIAALNEKAEEYKNAQSAAL